jgi:signal transduction histidine kinase
MRPSMPTPGRNQCQNRQRQNVAHPSDVVWWPMTAPAHLRHELRLLVLATLLPVWLGCALLIWKTQIDAERLIERDTELTVRVMLDAVDREVASSGQMAGIVTEQNLPDGWIGVIFDPTGTMYARSLYQASREAMSGTFDGRTVEGTLTTTAFARSQATGWGVAIGIPAAQLQDRLLFSIGLSLLGVLAFAGVSLVCAHFAGKRIILAFSHMAEAREASMAELRRNEENARVRALLFAHLSHTMHTPLQIIMGSADLLARDVRTADHCDRINRAVATVDHLIDEIIEHNQPITGNVIQLRAAAN